MENQMTIKRNEDNDLKYKQGLYDPNFSLYDPDKNNSSIYEGQNTPDEKLEYFTE